MTSDRTEPEVAAEGAHHGGLREDQLKAEIQALQSEAAALRVELDEARAELKHIVGTLRMMKQGASDQDLFRLAKFIEDRQLLKDNPNG